MRVAAEPRKMTEPATPLLIVVSGPPGAGKSTLARSLANELGLPLVAKDDFKETLFETLPAGTVEESRALGTTAWTLLFRVADELLRAGVSLVLEGNFASPQPFAGLPPARVVQLHLDAPRALLLERYRTRPRHPGHQTEAYLEEIAARIDGGEWRALDLPGAQLVEVDTGTPVDVAGLVRAFSGR